VYKVLLAEPVDRAHPSTTRQLLDWGQLGYALEPCSRTPSEAVAMLANHPISLVLIDMRDAEEDGLELCGRIREASRLPIILFGGRQDFELARKALYYQVSDYLPDPLPADELAVSLLNVKRNLDAAREPEPAAPAGETASPGSVIDKVKEYVDESLHQNITLKEISHILHFNYSYLGQKFKDQENMTFNEYLLRQRMEKAKRLLERSDMKVYEVAAEVGYTEMDWFYKKFKAYTGVSANEYRKLISITA